MQTFIDFGSYIVLTVVESGYCKNVHYENNKSPVNRISSKLLLMQLYFCISIRFSKNILIPYNDYEKYSYNIYIFDKII